MERTQKQVTTYQTIFVSVDGKEFNSESDCREWENSYEGTLTASWKLIPKIEANACLLGLPYSYEDKECYVLKPKDLEEITLINAYMEKSTHNNCCKLTTEHIEKLIALDFGYDYDYCDVYILENRINLIMSSIAEFERELTKEEE